MEMEETAPNNFPGALPPTPIFILSGVASRPDVHSAGVLSFLDFAG